MADIVDDLKDLLKQATTERSHFYVADCCRRSIAEIESLRAQFTNGVSTLLQTLGENNRILKETERRVDEIERRKASG